MSIRREHGPVTALWRVAAAQLLVATGSRTRYILIAWPIVSVPTALLGWLLAAVAETFEVPLPGTELFHSTFFKWFAVLVGPSIETVIMLGAYYVLGLFIWRSRALRIFTLAMLGALSHVGAGGWLHVVGVSWAFLVFSAALVTWQEQRRNWDAFLVVTGIHTLHNASVVAMAVLFP